jgi:hypothetical protein
MHQQLMLLLQGVVLAGNVSLGDAWPERKLCVVFNGIFMVASTANMPHSVVYIVAGNVEIALLLRVWQRREVVCGGTERDAGANKRDERSGGGCSLNKRVYLGSIFDNTLLLLLLLLLLLMWIQIKMIAETSNTERR